MLRFNLIAGTIFLAFDRLLSSRGHMEDLAEYFEKTVGRGVLATADKQGRVDAALYARPHFVSSDKLAFIMADRLTHSNIRQNPKAVYLYMEEGEYSGKRLFLTMVEESEDPALVASMARRGSCHHCSDESMKSEKHFVVYFKLDSVLPLVGDGK
jgi:hypothetical protein